MKSSITYIGGGVVNASMEESLQDPTIKRGGSALSQIPEKALQTSKTVTI